MLLTAKSKRQTAISSPATFANPQLLHVWWKNEFTWALIYAKPCQKPHYGIFHLALCHFNNPIIIITVLSRGNERDQNPHILKMCRFLPRLPAWQEWRLDKKHGKWTNDVITCCSLASIKVTNCANVCAELHFAKQQWPMFAKDQAEVLTAKQNKTGKHSGKFLCAGEEQISTEPAQMWC